MLNEVVVFLLLSLACYRMQRIITRDSFPMIAATRTRIVEKFGTEHSLSELVSCAWCMGFWFCGITFFIASLNTTVRWWPLQALAASGIVGQLDSRDQ